MGSSVAKSLRLSLGLDDANGQAKFSLSELVSGTASAMEQAIARSQPNYEAVDLLQQQLNLEAEERRQRDHQRLIFEKLTAPSLKPMSLTNGKIPRSDDGFSLLANALWLSDLHGRIDEMQRVLNANPIDVFLREYSKSKPFERMLSEHAIYDCRLKISRRMAFHEIDCAEPNVESMSLKFYIGDIRALVESGADIAQLRFVDLNLTDDELSNYALNPSPFEKRTPIARQSPSSFVKALKCLVVDYFERVDGSAEANTPKQEMPIAVEKQSFEKKRGGPYLDGSKAARGKEIGKLLSEWECETKGNPLLKLLKSDFIAVIENSCGFTQTMAASIWDDRPTKGRWSNKGAPKYGSTFISAVEIEDRFCLFKTT